MRGISSFALLALIAWSGLPASLARAESQAVSCRTFRAVSSDIFQCVRPLVTIADQTRDISATSKLDGVCRLLGMDQHVSSETETSMPMEASELYVDAQGEIPALVPALTGSTFHLTSITCR